jgi:hypothetical protein
MISTEDSGWKNRLQNAPVRPRFRAQCMRSHAPARRAFVPLHPGGSAWLSRDKSIFFGSGEGGSIPSSEIYYYLFIVWCLGSHTFPSCRLAWKSAMQALYFSRVGLHLSTTVGGGEKMCRGESDRKEAKCTGE